MSIDVVTVNGLLEKYIAQLEEAKNLPYHIGNPSYEGAIFGVVNLLTEIFGEAAAEEFLHRIKLSRDLVETELGEERDALIVYKSFCRHIDTCTAILRVYQDKLAIFGHGVKDFDRILPHIHADIRSAAYELFVDGHYANAVEDACKMLDDLVRKRSGRYDLSGTKLMQEVFRPEAPVLQFNEGKTESDKSEQRGMMFLYAGTMLALRNPRAHGLLEDAMEAAAEALVLISFLAKSLGAARLNLAADP